jgi:hypothetical protein
VVKDELGEYGVWVQHYAGRVAVVRRVMFNGHVSQIRGISIKEARIPNIFRFPANVLSATNGGGNEKVLVRNIGIIDIVGEHLAPFGEVCRGVVGRGPKSIVMVQIWFVAELHPDEVITQHGLAELSKLSTRVVGVIEGETDEPVNIDQ